MRESVIGIDLGTGSVKVVVSDLDGRIRGAASHDYSVTHPEPGWSESDPEQWWAATCACCAEALATADGCSVVAVGLSGQMHGVVLTRADGAPARPAMLWSDSRAQAELAVYETLPAAVRRRLGNPPVAGMAGPLLGWVVRHEPELVENAEWALQPKDWLRLRMTGTVATDPSDASATLMWDVAGDRWDVDVVGALGVDPSLLASVARWSGESGGTLLPSAARDLSLPAGIPVAVGGADTAVALFASGLTEPTQAQLTIGTGAQLVTPRPSLPASLPDRPVAQLYRTVEPSGWYAMAASLNGGSTLGWVCAILGLSWGELYASAALPARSDDPLFVPHLHGERTPYLDSTLRGAWTGLSPRHDRSRLARAALEGVAIAVRLAAGALDLDEGTAVQLAGGGTAAPAWRQMLADALGMPLRAAPVAAVSGLGAALLGARVVGVDIPPPRRAITECTDPDPTGSALFHARAQRLHAQIVALART